MKKLFNRSISMFVFVVFFTSTIFAQSEVSFCDRAIVVNPGQQDVVIFDGEITVNELILLENAELSFESSVNLDLLITKLILVVGNMHSTYVPESSMSGNVNFDGTFYMDSAIQIQILADLKSDITGNQDFVLSDLNLASWDNAEYVNTGNHVTVSSGHVSHTPVRIVHESEFTIVKTDDLSDRNIAIPLDDELMLSLDSYKEGDVYEIDQLEFTAFGLGHSSFDEHVMATLYADDVLVRTTTLRDGLLTFTNLNIESNNHTSIDIKLDFDALIPVNDQLWLEMTKVIDGGLNQLDVSIVASATVNVTDAVSAIVRSTLPGKMFLTPRNSGYNVAFFNISAVNADLKLTDLYLHNLLSLEISNRLNSIELITEDGSVIATTITDNGVAFEGLNSIIIEAGTRKSFMLTVSVNDVQNASELLGKDLLQFEISDEDFSAAIGTVDGIRLVSLDNGNVIENIIVDSDPISNWNKVVKNVPIFIKDDFEAEFAESLSNVMKFYVVGVGSGSLILENLFINISGLTEGTFKLYADRVYPDNLITTFNYDDDVISFNSLNTLDIGEQLSFYIVAENTEGTGERNFEISSVVFTSIYQDGTITYDSSMYYGTGLAISETYDQGGVGMKEIDSEYTKFVVYPNPANNIINISNFENADHAELFDMFGKKVMDIRESQIDISSLINGVYIIRFVDSDSRISESVSIIKQ